MTSFKDFLIEQNQIDSVEQVSKLIVRDCQPFLQRIQYHEHKEPLYRGIRYIDSDIIHKQSRLEERTPLSSTTGFHHAVNNYFEQQFGFRYRNGVFARSEHAGMMAYGQTFQMFPVGNFSVCWSPNVFDLFIEEMAILRSVYENSSYRSIDELKQHMRSIQTPREIPSELQQIFNQVLSKYNYTENQLQQIIDHDKPNEIMINCKSYYAVRHPYAQEHDLYKHIIGELNK